MKKKAVAADTDVDLLYQKLRNKHGGSNSRANGYLWHGYFENEQRILFSLMNPAANHLADLACGSGLMLQPLLDRKDLVVGVDFNAEACQAAKNNGLAALRGDVFHLPLGDDTFDELVTCQFFNQQQPQAVKRFIAESARVLRPGGRLVMIWRNGRVAVHRLAELIFGLWNLVRRTENFPYENHSFEAIEHYASEAGLDVHYQAVCFPPMRWVSEAHASLLARAIGASQICVLSKPTANA